MPRTAPPPSAPIAERLRESLTAACGAGLLVGVAAGAALGQVEGAGLVAGTASDLIGVVVGMLSAVLTVVGVVLSVLVVAQQLASQQYSPRAIRTALRDRRTRASLAALFAYIGLLVGALVTLEEDAGGSVAVTVAVGLAAVALGVVVMLIARVTDGLRSERLARRIAADALEALARIAAAEADLRGTPLTPAAVPQDAVRLTAPRTGYLQDVAVDRLAERLGAAGAQLLLEVPLGRFVAEGVAIGWAWPGGAPAGAARTALDGALRIGAAPTVEREISSDLQQLVDIAIRALSPAINDPRTAVEAVDAATLVLQGMAERAQRPVVGQAGGRVVLTVPRMLVWDGVASVVDQVRPFGGGFPIVVEALLLLLRGVAAVRPVAEAERVVAHLDALQAEVDASPRIEVDRRRSTAMIEEARAAVVGA